MLTVLRISGTVVLQRAGPLRLQQDPDLPRLRIRGPGHQRRQEGGLGRVHARGHQRPRHRARRC